MVPLGAPLTMPEKHEMRKEGIKKNIQDLLKNLPLLGRSAPNETMVVCGK